MNPRPTGYKPGALPTELQGHYYSENNLDNGPKPKKSNRKLESQEMDSKQDTKKTLVTWEKADDVVQWIKNCGYDKVDRSWFTILTHYDNILFFTMNPKKMYDYKDVAFKTSVQVGQVYFVMTHNSTGQPLNIFQHPQNMDIKFFNVIKSRWDAARQFQTKFMNDNENIFDKKLLDKIYY